MTVRILAGDCRAVMATLPEASVDAIVTDPPYELGFMGKGWDRTGVANDVETWRQALRVLKPGGHLLAFSGTRTYHRMVCAIEDAGFEVRDQIGWLYGSGFPKSLDVSKAIDRIAPRLDLLANRYALAEHIRTCRTSAGKTAADVNAWFGYRDGCQHWERKDASGHRFPTSADWLILRERLGVSDEWLPVIERAEAERAIIGRAVDGAGNGSVVGLGSGRSMATEYDVTAPATDAARQWAGWGTALKPAWEPVCVARKPLAGTVAANVLQHGTGALNIDGCRVRMSSADADRIESMGGFGKGGYTRPKTDETFMQGTPQATAAVAHDLGRWPANVIHDGSDAVLEAFPDSAARFFYTAKASAHDRNDGLQGMPTQVVSVWGGEEDDLTPGKKSTIPRANHHPTVKPTDLMRYLCRLVTPPGGVVLDPFAGSGSTLKAAELEGFDAIGIELDPAYIEIARARIAADAPLFADVEVA